jgi:hypothetical protein
MARDRNKILAALATLGNSELSSEHILDFFREIGGVDNHRGASLLLATHLEGVLQFSLITRLKIDPKDSTMYLDTTQQWAPSIEKSASRTLSV